MSEKKNGGIECRSFFKTKWRPGIKNRFYLYKYQRRNRRRKKIGKKNGKRDEGEKILIAPFPYTRDPISMYTLCIRSARYSSEPGRRAHPPPLHHEYQSRRVCIFFAAAAVGVILRPLELLMQTHRYLCSPRLDGRLGPHI